MPYVYEMALLDGFEWWQKLQQEESGDTEPPPEYSIGEYSVRHSESNEPYYPSASKGDVMATGEVLEGLFGINYVDERN